MAYCNDTGYPSVTEIIKPYIDDRWFLPQHAERGSAVHAACEAHLVGAYVMPLRPAHQPYFDSFRRWIDIVLDRVISVEKRLTNKELGYCGQYDAILIFKGDEEEYTMADWKTSQSYQPWWMLQSAAYRDLAATQSDITTTRGVCVRLKKDGSGCLINEAPNDYKNHIKIFNGLINANNFFYGDK